MTDSKYGNFLQKIILDLLARRNLNELLENILAAAGQIVNTPHGFVDLMNETTGDLRMMAETGLFEKMPNMPSKPGQGLVGKVWQSGEPLVIDDYDSWEERIKEREYGLVRAAAGMPLKSGDKVLGVLVLAYDFSSTEIFNQPKIEALKQFAALASLTIDNVRLYQSAKDSAERLLILYRATQEISTSLETEQVCRAIQQAVAQVMPCDEFVIDLYDEEANEIVPLYATELHGRRVYTQRYYADHGLSGHIVHTGNSVRWNTDEEIEGSNIIFEIFCSGPNTLSIIAVPLKLKGRIFGMISTQSYDAYAYSAEDQELLEVLAAHAAAAIENARLFSHTQELAATDAVTRLYNRHRFFELAEREFKRARRYHRPLTVLMVDIDDFKVINDTYGHSVGDETLFHISRSIHKELRETDILGRYGGDEFIVMLSETGIEQAQGIADRLCQQLRYIKIKGSTKSKPEITASIGIAGLDAAHDRFPNLLNHADQALYAAKAAGRNQAKVWSGS